ncbi:MAG: hypothetical protein ABIF87_08130 [Pseudomonadota bacterium]
MKRQAITLLVVCFLLSPFLSLTMAQDQSACTVSENYTSADSAGFHFDVHNDSGEYMGYITKLTNPDSMWGVWIEGKGSLNTLFQSKEAALAVICEQARK